LDYPFHPWNLLVAGFPLTCFSQFSLIIDSRLNQKTGFLCFATASAIPLHSVRPKDHHRAC
jgi:hypothetical protein